MAHSNIRPTYTLSHMPYVTARQSNDTICLWKASVDLAFRTVFFINLLDNFVAAGQT